jgi:hypothetical protein
MLVAIRSRRAVCNVGKPFNCALKKAGPVGAGFRQLKKQLYYILAYFDKECDYGLRTDYES